jgi:hypothetical protein
MQAQTAPATNGRETMDGISKQAQTNWIDDELAACHFSDARLDKRFKTLVKHLSEGTGETIPMACQDWAATKAAYRFFSNERISEQEIFSGHFSATQARFAATPGHVLVLHDTTEFSFQRENKLAIGMTSRACGGTGKDGRRRLHTICGMLQHSSMVVTQEGLPLGIAAVKYWTRKKFKGTNELKKHVNGTRVPIEQKESVRWLENMRQSTALLKEPGRCVHIGDRESDIYELFCEAGSLGTHYVIRTCVDRLAGEENQTVLDSMDKVSVNGVHEIEVRDQKGNTQKALLELKFCSLEIHPPIGKAKRYPSLNLTIIHAQERDVPLDRDRIDWKLITNMPVTTPADAVEKLQWYALRWKIEVFHKILKSGCKAEDAKLRTAERLVRLISVYCILGWRIFWMTMINRVATDVPADVVFTKVEQTILNRIIPSTNTDATSHGRRESIKGYILKVARLGGYLNRKQDGPPGNTVMWRGLSRLTDIVLGFELANKCG